MRSSTSSCRSKRRFYTPKEIREKTHCDYKIPIYEQAAWTPTNPGRRFKGCPTRKCGVYGFLDEELPCDYYKDLFLNLHNEYKELRLQLSNHIGGMTVQQPSPDLSMELIYQDLNAFKSKAKVYDSLLMVVFGLIIVLILCLIVVSLKN